MDKRIERSLNENTGITEEFEELSRDCFERIFDMLGKRNFERWIDKRKLAPRIKKLVVESMEEKEKREHPSWAGYHTRGTNRIRLKKQSADVATHEKFHFITDNGEHFPTFMNEGLTEYLKSMVEGKVTSYHENVAVVKFLHNMVGDSIIKAYLLGVPNIFDNKICSMLTGETPDQQSNAKSVLKEFYENLNIFHEYNNAQSHYDSAIRQKENEYTEAEINEMQENVQKAREKYLEVKDDIIVVLQTIAISKIEKMAESFEFYQNGVLDITLVNRTIMDVLRQMPLHQFTNDFSMIGMLQQNVASLATMEVIKKSHLATYADGKENTIESLAAKMMPIVNYSSSNIQISPANISKDDPIFKTEEPKALETILTKISDEASKSGVTTYLEKLAMLQEKFYISDTQMDYILTKHNIDRFSESTNVAKINSGIKDCFPLFRALYKLERQREKDTISTRELTFREIGKNRYLEVRDNQRFFIEIGEDGSIYEEELKYGNSVIFRGNERLDINYKNGMDDIEVINNGRKVRPGIPTSFREIKDLALGNAISKIVSEKITANEYTTILDDAPNPYEIEGVSYTGEVDTRSRKINLEKFIQDLKSIQEGIPENVRQAVFNDLAYFLLDKTYGTGPKRNEHGYLMRDDAVSDIYIEFRDNFEKMFDAKTSELDKKKYLRRSEDATSELNKVRKARVTESAKTAAISFESPEAQKRYFSQIERENQRKREEEEYSLQKRISKFDYASYIDYQENTESPEYNLSGVYTTDDIDTTDRQVKVTEFAEAIKEFLISVPEDKKAEVFDKIFNKMIARAYGIGKVDLNNDKELTLATATVRKSIKQNVFEDKEIDEDVLTPDLEVLNKFHRELAESNKQHTLISFKDDNTRRMFEVIKGLVKSGASEGEMGIQVRTLIEIHNEMMKEKDDTNHSRE